jgi:hypothetical protein
MAVLHDLGLLEEDDRDKGFVALAVAAFDRARDRALESQLASAIAQAAAAERGDTKQAEEKA